MLQYHHLLSLHTRPKVFQGSIHFPQWISKRSGFFVFCSAEKLSKIFLRSRAFGYNISRNSSWCLQLWRRPAMQSWSATTGVVSPSHGPISELNLSELKKSLLIWFQQKPQSILAEQNALFFIAWMYQCVSTLDYLSTYQWIKGIQTYQQCSKHAARRWALIIEPYLIISLKFKYASSTTGWTARPLLCST